MKVIKQGDERVAKIINKKKLNTESEYRLAHFTYLYTENGRHLVQNTLTKEVTELTDAEWTAFQKIGQAHVGYSYLAENGLERLAVSRYIVEADHDELKQYQTVIFLLKTMAKEKPGLKTYTILPTTGCNARCVYCYEEGYTVKTMTQETADRLIDFICETRHDDKITLRWFGGEPTICAKTISYICRELEKRGVPFKSTMVTNASLITKELAHEMKELWHLERVQVSLDGAKQDYELRKQYVSPKLHNYDVVMQAIKYLADEGIKINLRCNFDGENFERLKGFIDEIKESFGAYQNVSLYLGMLFQEQHKDSCIDLYMVNDDKPLLKITDGEVIAYGTPYNGKHRLGANISVPLKGLCILTRSEENTITKITKAQAYAVLLQQVYRPQNGESMRKTLLLIDKLAELVPLYRLGCNMDISAAEVAYNGMKG